MDCVRAYWNRVLLAFLGLVWTAYSQISPPVLRIDVDLVSSGNPNSRFALHVAQFDQPIIEGRMFNAGNPFIATGYVWTLSYAESDTSTSFWHIAGVPVGSNRVYFVPDAQSFPRPARNWYAQIKCAISNGPVVAYGKGTLNVRRAPDMYIGNTYLGVKYGTGPVNWDALGPYYGTWPIYGGSNVVVENSVSGLVLHSSLTIIGSNLLDGATVTNIVNSLAFPLASGVDLSNRVVTLESWGNHATNNYAVNGDNISGNWFPVNNLKLFDTAFIGGGQGNVAVSDYSVVVGGHSNTVHMAGPSHPNQWFSTIGGGTRNFARGRANVIAGGEANVITDVFFVAHNVIGGGLNNKIDGANNAVVLGGQNNTIYGNYGAIIGGYDNAVTWHYGVVLGGAHNIAGAYSIAAGVGAHATNMGSMVISLPGTTNATFSAIGDNTFNVRAVGGIYFLSPTLFIQDTNGDTVAYFSANGSAINGELDLPSYVTTSAHANAINVLTTGKHDLAAAIAWSNAHHARLVVLETGALTKVQAALTYATTGALVAVSNALSGRIAVLETGALTKVEAAVTYATTGGLAAAVNGLNNDLVAASNALRNSIGLTITNYTLADAALSNSLAGVWTYASNTHAKTWSAYPATQTVEFANNAMNNVNAIYFQDWTVDPTNAPNLYMSMSGTNYYLYIRRGIYDMPRFVWHQGNFNPSAYQTIAAYNSALTSTLWRWSGFVYPTSPTNPPGARGRMFESNGWLYVWSDASNAWGRVQLDFNW